ncbi:MAG: hypothetical protein ACRDK7_11110 [Solirubrobacteraceae bacterium]
MTDTIVITAEVIGDVREGCFCVINGAAQDVYNAAGKLGREDHPEWYAEPRQRLERAWALLDQIGWTGPAEDKTVDLRYHERGLGEAVEQFLPILEDLLSRGEAVAPTAAQALRRLQALQAFAGRLPTATDR